MPRASCYYAAARLAAGRMPVQAEISAALDEPTAALVRYLNGAGLPTEAVCERLVSAAATVDSTREIARTALVRAVGAGRALGAGGAGGAESSVERLAGLLASLEAAYDRAFPTIGDELALRSRPLWELWEAHGPGLLAAVGRTTDKRLLVDEAAVLLVQPFSATGGGAAYAASNMVALEAVLANPHPRLPETVRLAWLLSRLQADLPDFVESLPAGGAEPTIAWAMLPAVLDAAVDLEVVRPADDLLAVAAEAWELPVPRTASVGASAEDATTDEAAREKAAQAVAGWWKTLRGRPVPFAVALGALAQLLAEAGEAAEAE
jgi:hypothetical protein